MGQAVRTERKDRHGAAVAPREQEGLGGPGWPPQQIISSRAPAFERAVLRSPHRTCSGQVLPRHTRGSPYRCCLPALAGFDDSRCVGPNLQRRPMRLTQHDSPSGGNSTPLERIAGYRAPLPPRLARPRHECTPRKEKLAEGVGFEPTAQGLPVHGISSAAPSAARSPLRRKRKLAEGRGFEPPRDRLSPYPISSRTPSTGLGHPSAPMLFSHYAGANGQVYPSGYEPGREGVA